MVVSLTSVNQQLRGYLSRFLIEMNTGLYIGNASARVRDFLIDRINEEIGTGKAVISWSTDNEQGFALKMIGYEDREIADVDGIMLVQRLSVNPSAQQNTGKHWSKAYNRRRFGS